MAYFYILTAIFIWSSLGIFVRLSGASVHVILFYATLFSLVFQSGLFLNRDYRQSFPPPGKIPLVFILGFCLLVNTFTFLFAYAKTTIANAVLTHYIAPVVVAVLAVFFLKEKITRRVVASLVLSSIGLWIMLGGATFSDCIRSVVAGGLHMTDDMLGILSGLASGVAYAVLIILARVFTQRYNPYSLVFIQNTFIMLMLMPFVREFPADKMWMFVVMGLMHSTIAPFLYYRGMREVKANSTAILGYLEPVGAIVLSILFLNEWPKVNAVAGGMLIIISGYITITQREAG